MYLEKHRKLKKIIEWNNLVKKEMAEKGSDNSFDFTSLGSLSSWYSLLLFRKNIRYGPDNEKTNFILKKIQLLCIQQSRTISHKQFI